MVAGRRMSTGPSARFWFFVPHLGVVLSDPPAWFGHRESPHSRTAGVDKAVEEEAGQAATAAAPVAAAAGGTLAGIFDAVLRRCDEAAMDAFAASVRSGMGGPDTTAAVDEVVAAAAAGKVGPGR